MKLLIIISFVLINFQTVAQSKKEITGIYYFKSEMVHLSLELYEDSTFIYYSHQHLINETSNGKYQIEDDTIILNTDLAKFQQKFKKSPRAEVLIIDQQSQQPIDQVLVRFISSSNDVIEVETDSTGKILLDIPLIEIEQILVNQPSPISELRGERIRMFPGFNIQYSPKKYNGNFLEIVVKQWSLHQIVFKNAKWVFKGSSKIFWYDHNTSPNQNKKQYLTRNRKKEKAGNKR